MSVKHGRGRGRPLRGVEVTAVTPRSKTKLSEAKRQIERAIREAGFHADARCAGAGRRYR